MEKVLITGGAGFIGSHIADVFCENNYEVIIVDNLSGGKVENISHLTNYKFYNVDIKDMEGLRAVFAENEGIKYVVHTAAQVSVSKSVEDLVFDANENIMGLIKVLEMCKEFKVEKILFSSTAAVYGVPQNAVSRESDGVNPISPYGLSKVTGENYIKLYKDLFGIDYVIFRYSNVYGPRQNAHGEAGVVSIFSDTMLENKDIYINGDGEQTRDFIYVKDVAYANYICALGDIKNETMNVSTNEEVSINKLFQKMKDCFSYTLEAKYREARVGDIRNSRLDNSLLRNKSGWNCAYDLESGLKEYALFLKE